eukprot:Nk52_evm23s2367 gene=Nk52_evmTU23s2367
MSGQKDNSKDAVYDGHEVTYVYPKRILKATILGGIPLVCFAILVVEMCERFGFYTNVSVNALYVKNIWGFSQDQWFVITTMFSFWVYLTPLIGGFIADAYWGKKTAIVVFGLMYLIGMTLQFIASLPFTWADFPNSPGHSEYITYAGLAIIGLAAGVIKANQQDFKLSVERVLDGLCLPVEHTKTRDTGPAEEKGILRNASVRQCPILALALMFFFKFHVMQLEDPFTVFYDPDFKWDDGDSREDCLHKWMYKQIFDVLGENEAAEAERDDQFDERMKKMEDLFGIEEERLGDSIKQHLEAEFRSQSTSSSKDKIYRKVASRLAHIFAALDIMCNKYGHFGRDVRNSMNLRRKGLEDKKIQNMGWAADSTLHKRYLKDMDTQAMKVAAGHRGDSDECVLDKVLALYDLTEKELEDKNLKGFVRRVDLKLVMQAFKCFARCIVEDCPLILAHLAKVDGMDDPVEWIKSRKNPIFDNDFFLSEEFIKWSKGHKVRVEKKEKSLRELASLKRVHNGAKGELELIAQSMHETVTKGDMNEAVERVVERVEQASTEQEKSFQDLYEQ